MAGERRSFPRYPVQCPVEVTLPESMPGATFAASSGTLSRTSIQIECTAELVTALLKQQKLPYSCRLEFKLPGHKHTFRIDASVVTHRRLSQQSYVLVLLLRHADADQENLLDNQLHRQLKPIGLD